MGITERKEREKTEMRSRILETAMKLFLEKGFDNVSIRRIADHIEYSPATIYLYFKNKDEILYTLHTEGFEELYKRQAEIVKVKDPLKRLQKHGEIYVTFAMEKPEYYDLMFIMRGPAKKIKEEKKWEKGLRSYEVLRKNVEECMDAGLLPKINVDVATFTFWSHVHGMASLVIRQRCIMFPEEKLNALMMGSIHFMNGMLQGKPP